MTKYIIERDIPDIGSAELEALRGAAEQSNNEMQSSGTHSDTLIDKNNINGHNTITEHDSTPHTH